MSKLYSLSIELIVTALTFDLGLFHALSQHSLHLLGVQVSLLLLIQVAPDCRKCIPIVLALVLFPEGVNWWQILAVVLCSQHDGLLHASLDGRSLGRAGAVIVLEGHHEGCALEVLLIMGSVLEELLLCVALLGLYGLVEE